MKTGIITFHDTTNYGSYLQTYGLYKKIIDLGHECEVIDYECDNIVNREMPPRLSFSIKGIITYFCVTRKILKKYYGLYNGFLKKNIQLSRHYTKNNICEADKCYDKIIAGSDIIWGLDITGGDYTYFLDFVKEKCRKAAFSSSIGNPFSKDNLNFVKPLLNDIDYIAVREVESADWIEELTGTRPKVVCDPTMLLTASEWDKLATEKFKDTKYALVYFDNSNGDCLRMASEYARLYNIKVYVVGCSIRPVKDFEFVLPKSIGDFLSLIKYSTFTATTSYHGLLFSVYFNRNLVYFNNVHKSRINTLTSKLGITMREGSNCSINNLQPINYDVVNAAVEEYRNYSINCLKELLDK